MIYGAAIGDIAGSRFEAVDYKKTDFEFFHYQDKYTDDTVMTFAIYDACSKLKRIGGYENDEQAKNCFITTLQEWGRKYPYSGYGSSFSSWIFSSDPKPYNSWGNGSAMRVSPIGWMFMTLEETEHFAKLSAEITHNHPEGIKGAQSIAGAIYLARTGHSKRQIKKYIQSYGYKLRRCNSVRKTYNFDVSCQETIPVAVEAFLESKNFEHAVRLAISMGGDSDTIGAITGSIAEAFYGIPDELKDKCRSYLSKDMIHILDRLSEGDNYAKEDN